MHVNEQQKFLLCYIGLGATNTETKKFNLIAPCALKRLAAEVNRQHPGQHQFNAGS